MRLIEFADPSLYAVSDDDATSFLKQLERLWPHDISVWRRSLLALRVGHNIGNSDCPIRDGAV